MPDWFTHSLIGWITGKTTKLDVGLVAIGALIPDISKLSLLFNSEFERDLGNLFNPIHTPVGAILIACVIVLFFEDTKKVFLYLGVGIMTHFILDMFLLNVSGGIPLLFPFSWDEWQLGFIRSDDYTMTILAIIAAVIVYSLYFYYKKRKLQQYKDV
jgi:hypothetical protein